MASKKGSKLYHNPVTKEARMHMTDPGPPWVAGRPPWQPQVRGPEQYRKSSETKRRRLEEYGHTEAELRGYEKLSKTRLEGDYSPTRETRNKISDTLTGRPQVWEENKSRASCRRGQCDTVYVIKFTTPGGKTFGKWGSTKEESFKYRVKEFNRKKFQWEICYWEWYGEATEDVEAFLGRRLSPYRDPEVPHFFGHTETFAWTPDTEKLLKETINALEENPPS